MSLTGSLYIGRSALAASQLALQVTGNNLANASTPGYTRQVARLNPLGAGVDSSGLSVGRGVQVQHIRRQIDQALQTRLEDAVSREQGTLVEQQILSQVEAILNELSGSDLSSELGRFFNAFSEVANNPSATETRAVAVEQGVALAGFLRGLRSDLEITRSQIDSQLDSATRRADDILREIANLNIEIARAEQGQGVANEMRDHRDGLVRELSELMDVTTIEQPNGAIDVLVGSTTLLTGNRSRGVEFYQETVGGKLSVSVRVKSTGETLPLTTGRLGALLGQRASTVEATIDDLDRVTANLIHEVNRIHSSGEPGRPLTDSTGWLRVGAGDQGLAFNDPSNATMSRLTVLPKNGSFTVYVRDGSGATTTTQIEVDLDGIDALGAAGYGDDTSLADLAAMLNGIPNLNAQVTAGGQLRVFTDSGYSVSFGDDTSGVLAVLGINTYFEGDSAANIAVRQEIQQDPLRLVAGTATSANGAALAMSALRDASVEGLGGLSLTNVWLKTVERVGSEGASALVRASAASLVKENLQAQRDGVSGVSVDEESINLLTYQRQYQGAARFITVVDELMQTLLAIV
ncbi:MAG: flagellar hook-associated protein FlgK [Phycisphaerales bacterium]